MIEYATQTGLGKSTAYDVRVVAKVNDDIKQNPAYWLQRFINSGYANGKAADSETDSK